MAASHATRRTIYWLCVLALFNAAFANAIRVGAAGAIKSALLDPIDARHSGEMIGAVLGNAFLGFALSLLVISPLLDRFGARRVLLFAGACFIVGPLLVLISAHAGPNVMLLLNFAMVIWGCGWGATEASINPVTARLFPDDKTGKLNSLHAWWPMGIVLGGLLAIVVQQQLAMDWRWLVAMPLLPGAALVILVLRRPFPAIASVETGTSFRTMLSEPFRRPGFWIFFGIMLLTASAELAPAAWVDVALTQTVGMPGIVVLVYVAAVMFVMRHFAGSLAHRLSDMGLLLICTLPACAGLFLLSRADTPTSALIAATLWAIGVCFMWPTILAAVARRYPQSGSWGIGLIGFAGAIAIYFVLPQLGRIYDAAKIASAGGAEAFAALAPGSARMQAVLRDAAEISFQTVAVIPAVLLGIFALLWLWERRVHAAGSARA
ncbi:MAG: MFS transporter [Pseudomonadota bacterium]